MENATERMLVAALVLQAGDLELLGSQFLHLENEPANNTYHIRVVARLNKVHIMSLAQHLT